MNNLLTLILVLFSYVLVAQEDPEIRVLEFNSYNIGYQVDTTYEYQVYKDVYDLNILVVTNFTDSVVRVIIHDSYGNNITNDNYPIVSMESRDLSYYVLCTQENKVVLFEYSDGWANLFTGSHNYDFKFDSRTQFFNKPINTE